MLSRAALHSCRPVLLRRRVRCGGSWDKSWDRSYQCCGGRTGRTSGSRRQIPWSIAQLESADAPPSLRASTSGGRAAGSALPPYRSALVGGDSAESSSRRVSSKVCPAPAALPHSRKKHWHQQMAAIARVLRNSLVRYSAVQTLSVAFSRARKKAESQTVEH